MEMSRAHRGSSAVQSVDYQSLSTMPSKLQFALPQDSITPPETLQADREQGSTSLDQTTEGWRLNVPSTGGMLAGARLPAESICCDRLDRKRKAHRASFVAVDQIVGGIPKKERSEMLLSLTPSGCWFPRFLVSVLDAPVSLGGGETPLQRR